MRHKKHQNKLNVAPSHRKALIKNLSISLIDAEKIKTTHAKCKALRSYIEKLITLSKEDSVQNRRLAFRKLGNKKAVSKLFTDIGPKFAERNGGYTRITKLADTRVGDGAKVSFISFV
jgi:large subunit ribosomal protein L17